MIVGSKRVAAVVMIAATLSGPQWAAPATATGDGSPAERYIVVHEDAANDGAARSRLTREGGRVAYELRGTGVTIVDSRRPSFAAAMRKSEGVAGVFRDRAIKWMDDLTISMDGVVTDVDEECMGPTAPRVDRHPWNMRVIHADDTARRGFTGTAATVAVLDTGINTAHVDLAESIDRSLSRSFVPSEPSIEDANLHGSHVAGIIAASHNHMGVQGVAPRARLVVLKVLGSNGVGTWSGVLRALDYAARVKVDVVNMSFGEMFDPTAAETVVMSKALDRAIARVWGSGAVVVTSAGNDSIELNASTAVLPAQSKHVITVAATAPVDQRRFDQPASYSNFGWPIDIAAPGGDAVSYDTFPRDMVLSTASRVGGCLNRLAWRAGTSMAAAHVSGVAALIMGRFRHIAPDVVERTIEQTAEDVSSPGRDLQTGHGRVDALAAVAGRNWSRSGLRHQIPE